MKKVFFLFFLFCGWSSLFAQKVDTSKVIVQEIEEVFTYKDYNKKYKMALKRVRRVYPLALYAAQKLKEIDGDIAQIDSRRKKKKYGKHANEDLKADFQYVIRDLYIEEGKLLMKLIHRETGLTVAEIIKKYRGKFRSEIQDNLGKIWDQDLDATYQPEGEDWIVEQVIKDIKSGKVSFDDEAKILSKEEYKTNKKEYHINKKEAKKAMRVKRKSGS